jgi:hypothetical protein
MTTKRKFKVMWGTRMRNPNTVWFPEFVGVLAPSKKKLREFYEALFPDKIGFKPERCQRVKCSPYKPRRNR